MKRKNNLLNTNKKENKSRHRCTPYTLRCEEERHSDSFQYPERGGNTPVCCAGHLVELLFYVTALFERNEIPYFIMDGTFLGAVRHRGMIPWDTDMDIGILERDCERVKKLLMNPETPYYFTADGNLLRLNYGIENTLHVDIWAYTVFQKPKGEEWIKFYFDAQWIQYPMRHIFPLKRYVFYDRELWGPDKASLLEDIFDKDVRTHAYKQYEKNGKRFLLTDKSPACVNLKSVQRAMTEKQKHFYARGTHETYRQFLDNIVLLHDVLNHTPLAKEYFIWGGALLGWARENRMLPHDEDFDLGYLSEHRDQMLEAIPFLIDAGFEPACAYTNNQQQYTQYYFYKDGKKFEFFEFQKIDDKLRYWLYSFDRRREYIAEVSYSGWSSMKFLGRDWKKFADHKKFLTEVYGNWHIPQSDYLCIRDEQSIMSHAPWLGHKSGYPW